MNRPTFSLFALALLLTASVRAEDAAADPLARMRDALRNTILQLRSAQNDNATLQAAKDESDKANQALQAKVAALTKQTKDDADALAEAKLEAGRQEVQIATYEKNLVEWKAQYQKLGGLATKTEQERARLAGQNILLQRRVDDLENKNIELYKTGSEILKRYRDFGLGTALLAREPFVGVTKVKLENLVQGYGDALLDHKDKP
jgi:predicted  nucleic acid-binding Zn-ribbon protein